MTAALLLQLIAAHNHSLFTNNAQSSVVLYTDIGLQLIY